MAEIGHYDFVDTIGPDGPSPLEAIENFVRYRRAELPDDGWRLESETETTTQFVFERDGRILGRLHASRREQWAVTQVELCDDLIEK